LTTENLIVIPARHGSSLKRKNMLPCFGRPLIHYSFQSSNVNFPHDTLVSTDDIEIKAEAEFFGMKVHDRQKRHAGDDTTLNTVLKIIAQENPQYTNFICLAPTSPLRTNKHVEEAYEMFRTMRADSLISVCEDRHSIWRHREGTRFGVPLVERNLNRQKVVPVYIGNGAITISNRDGLIKTAHRVFGKVALYEMDWYSSLDVHTQKDVELAEFYLSKQ